MDPLHPENRATFNSDLSDGEAIQIDINILEEYFPQLFPISHDPKLMELLEDLPFLKEEDLQSIGKHDDSCPICLTPFLAILATEEIATAMDSPAIALQDLGVTQLTQSCGHVFCRKDISAWLRRSHGNCPACRAPVLPTSSSGSQPGNDDGEPVDTATLLRELLASARNSGPANAALGEGFSLHWNSADQWPADEDARDGYSTMYS